MRIFIRRGISALAACVCLSMAPVAAAQDAATSSQIAQGPMIVERVKSGFVVAPDFKITEVDRRTSELAGGYAGWLNDRTFFIGGAGYWLANGNRDREMAYGGVVVGWLTRADRRIGFGVKGLVGAGEATVSNTVTELVFSRDDRNLFGPSRTPGERGLTPTAMSVRVRARGGFFVAEPEANLLVTLTRSLRLSGGVGYRVIGGTRNLDSRLRGVSGSIALQIGGGF